MYLHCSRIYFHYSRVFSLCSCIIVCHMYSRGHIYLVIISISWSYVFSRVTSILFSCILIILNPRMSRVFSCVTSILVVTSILTCISKYFGIFSMLVTCSQSPFFTYFSYISSILPWLCRLTHTACQGNQRHRIVCHKCVKHDKNIWNWNLGNRYAESYICPKTQFKSNGLRVLLGLPINCQPECYWGTKQLLLVSPNLPLHTRRSDETQKEKNTKGKHKENS